MDFFNITIFSRTPVNSNFAGKIGSKETRISGFAEILFLVCKPNYVKFAVFYSSPSLSWAYVAEFQRPLIVNCTRPWQVHDTAGRDCKPGQLDEMIGTLKVEMVLSFICLSQNSAIVSHPVWFAR
jgi:hypothetical protein